MRCRSACCATASRGKSRSPHLPSLRRRFLQNQEDCNFTIMALLPTLSAQIFKKMDVDATREELKRVIGAPAKTKESEGVHGSAAAEAIRAGTAVTQGVQAEEGAQDGQPGAPAPSAADAASGLDRLSEAPPPALSDEARLPATPAPAPPAALSEDERRQTKLRLWNDIKHSSFARTFTTLYTLVFLSLQTYIQLNLIGRRAYLAALESQASRDLQQRAVQQGTDDEKHHIALHDASEMDALLGAELGAEDGADARLDQDTEKKYLTSSYWFLHRGWSEVAERVQAAVHAEIGDMPLRTILTYHHFQGLTERIRLRLEGASDESERTGSFSGPHGFRNLLLPDSIEEECEMLVHAGAVAPGTPADEAVTPALRLLLDETKDLVDSPDFARIFSVSCDHVFGLLMHNLAPSFGVQAFPDDLLHSAADARLRARALAAEKPLELARILPLIALQAQVAFNTSPNEYVEAITDAKELRAFSVLIYSAWENELAP